MRRSHKARLALVATAVAALVMAAAFLGVSALVRRGRMREERDEIAQAFRTVSGLPPPRFSMLELGEAGPALRARVFDGSGRLVATRGRMPDPPSTLREGFAARGRWLFFAARSRGERVVIARDLEEMERGQRELATILAALWPPLSLLVGIATWLAAQSVFRPLGRLAHAAAEIEGTDLAQRLPAPDQAEFGALADVLNRMLARIEESALRSERFAVDAAHELRTPLAVIRAQIETTLLRPRAAAEHEASHRAVLAEAERLSALAEALLRSTRAADEPAAAPVDLAPLVRACAARFGGAPLRLDLVPARACVLPEEVDVVVANLLGNALRHSPPDAAVRIALAPYGGGAELRVEDRGPGVAPEHAERVFERLYRAEEDRARDSGGAGVGLAVCRRLIEGRGGTIGVEPTPHGGATFVVRWPL